MQRSSARLSEEGGNGTQRAPGTPGGGLMSPEGREMQRTMSNLGSGYAFSENEPSTAALHATHGGSAHSLMRNTVSGASRSADKLSAGEGTTPPSWAENSNVQVNTARSDGMSDRTRHKSESL